MYWIWYSRLGGYTGTARPFVPAHPDCTALSVEPDAGGAVVYVVDDDVVHALSLSAFQIPKNRPDLRLTGCIHMVAAQRFELRTLRV